MSAANVLQTARGRLRPVCQFCGKVTRRTYAPTDGRVPVWELPSGWATAPYPTWLVHDDGSTGTTYECPSCRAALDRGEALTVRRHRPGRGPKDNGSLTIR